MLDYKQLRKLLKIENNGECRYHFNIQLGNFYPLTIKIETNSLITYQFLMNGLFPFEIKEKKEIDLHFTLSAPLKKKDILPLYNTCQLLKMRDDFSFLYRVTSQGSLFILDKSKKGYAFIQQRDLEQIDFYLAMLLNNFIRIRNSFRLHAACLVKEGKALLLAGESGSGKSTLSRNLLRSRLGFKMVHEDRCSIYKVNAKIYVSSPVRWFYGGFNLKARRQSIPSYQCQWLILPRIVSQGKSKMIPLSANMALERLIPSAEMGTDNNKPMVTMRLYLLKRLITQSQRYLLNTGRELKDSLPAVRRLFYPLIRRED